MDEESMVRGWLAITVMQTLGVAYQCTDPRAMTEKLFNSFGKTSG